MSYTILYICITFTHFLTASGRNNKQTSPHGKRQESPQRQLLRVDISESESPLLAFLFLSTLVVVVCSFFTIESKGV